MITNIDEALEYFKMAESYGCYTPSVQRLSTMTEEEIIEEANDLGSKGNFLAQVDN